MTETLRVVRPNKHYIQELLKEKFLVSETTSPKPKKLLDQLRDAVSGQGHSPRCARPSRGPLRNIRGWYAAARTFPSLSIGGNTSTTLVVDTCTAPNAVRCKCVAYGRLTRPSRRDIPLRTGMVSPHFRSGTFPSLRSGTFPSGEYRLPGSCGRERRGGNQEWLYRLLENAILAS